jgi:hypothetical protein
VALSVIPARLEYACGHASLVTLPAFRGEGSRMRSQRIEAEKAAAALRPCDFCPPAASVVVHVAEAAPLAANGFASAADTAHAPAPEPTIAPVGEVMDSPSATPDAAPVEAPAAASNLPSVEPEAAPPAAPVAVPQPVDVPEPVEVPEPVARKQRARARPAARPIRREPAPRSSTPRARPARANARATKRERVSLIGFRVRYQRELVLEAADLRAALSQAEALGALDVTRIVRID